MMNYIYGAVTTVTFVTMIDIIDKGIPNSLGYYVGLLLPF
jgi:hypothetical protein